MRYAQINHISGVANEEHLRYFHFCGRLLGKALFDRQIVSSHLVLPLYKHILSWPLLVSDIESLDNDVYQNLLKLLDIDDVSVLDLDFTVTESVMGDTQTKELVLNGESIVVTNDNLEEYLRKFCEYRLLNRVRDQVNFCFETAKYSTALSRLFCSACV